MCNDVAIAITYVDLFEGSKIGNARMFVCLVVVHENTEKSGDRDERRYSGQ